MIDIITWNIFVEDRTKLEYIIFNLIHCNWNCVNILNFS